MKLISRLNSNVYCVYRQVYRSEILPSAHRMCVCIYVCTFLITDGDLLYTTLTDWLL